MTPAIVLVTTSFPIHQDGSEAAGSFVSDLAEELALHSPVRVVAPGLRTGREKWTGNVEVFRFAAPDKPLSTLKIAYPNDMISLFGVLRRGEEATRQAVAAGPTAHILALWALPSGHWARRVSMATAVPYSVWTLGSDIWTLGRVPFVRSVLRGVLRHARELFSDGLQLARDTGRIAGRDVEFLPSTRRVFGAHVERAEGDSRCRMLFLGRWHPNKGVDLLIESLWLLDPEDWARIRSVTICGGGLLQDQVLEGVGKLQGAGFPVIAGGYLDKSEAEAALCNADYLLIPSRIESIPVVFSDAVKLGCAVVTTPVGDLKVLVEQIPACGIAAENISAAAFSRAIQEALGTLPETFSLGISRAAEAFSLEATAQRIVRLGEEAQHAHQ